MSSDQKVPLLIKLRFEINQFFFINDTIYIQHRTANRIITALKPCHG